jgi:hypothetical protein
MFGKRKRVSNPSDVIESGVRGHVASNALLLPMQEMSGNMLVMKDGSYRMLLKVGAVNMDLKGIDEQMAILGAFQKLLSMLKEDWPMQIVLSSAFMDPEPYMREYRERLRDPQLSQAMRSVIEDHLAHYEEQAEANHVLERSYYVVVSWYDTARAPTGESVAGGLPGGGVLAKLMDGSGSEKNSEITVKDKERARVQLVNRAQSIRSQLAAMSIKSSILNDYEIMSLLRRMYNPGAPRRDFKDGVRRSAVIQTRRGDEGRTRVRGALPAGTPDDYQERI